MANHRVKILEPEREEYRTWVAKKQDLDPNRVRAADMLLCEHCGRPIGPDALIFELAGQRACGTCRSGDKVSL